MDIALCDGGRTVVAKNMKSLVFIDVATAKVKQTLELAADKVRRENHSRTELMQGAYLRDVFAKYGVL